MLGLSVTRLYRAQYQIAKSRLLASNPARLHFCLPRTFLPPTLRDDGNMAAHKTSMTRSSSTESSALSNIDVSGAQQEDDNTSDRVSASTPPTSLAESGSLGSGKAGNVAALGRIAEEEDVVGAGGRRPKRVRSGVSTYNLKKLSDEAQQAATTVGSSRNVSGLTGRTLVEGEVGEEEQGETPFGSKVEKALDMEWELPAGSEQQRKSPGRLQRRPSVKDRVRKVAGKVGSVLGKRGRDMLEAGKRRLGKKEQAEEEEVEEEELPRWKKELDTGTKGLLDEIDLDAEVDVLMPPPAKKARLSGKAALREIPQPPSAPIPVEKPSTAGKKMKKWQKEGLYVGQDPNFDPTKPGGGGKKLQKKRPGSSASDTTDTTTTTTAPKHKHPPIISLPLFSYLDKQRDFILPFDVFAPSLKKGDEKPKDWHQLNKNRLVGEARELWDRSEKLPASMCVCQAPPAADHHHPSGGDEHNSCGCDDQCLNRVMQYECNDDNCALPASACGNRAFAELATRTKKGGAFDIGVEVLKTPNRGFGVRSCRTWAPGQIIMEYTGEIISEGECQRRMREEYRDKQCYYLMELEKGLIIDGAKGSMARFINHSCEPNCEVRMVKVNGTPRMGVFAGEEGVVTGEELTYDYNFDNFGERRQVCYCGAPSCRGFLTRRLNAAEVKRAAREEGERRRVVAEAAQRAQQEDERRKKVKGDRGSGWTGWVAVDDPETKERLRREKREREEAERNSERARRLAARRGSLPAVASTSASASAAAAMGEKAGLGKQSGAKRRKTTAFEHEAVRQVLAAESVAAESAAADDTDDAVEGAFAPAASEPAAIVRSKKLHTRTLSTGSKFTEDLPRPTSSISTITRKTEISITAAVRQESISQEIADTDDEVDEQAVEEEKVSAGGKKRKRPLLDAARSVGQAFKSGLASAAGKGSAGGSGGGVGGSGKLKQSTLSFARKA